MAKAKKPRYIKIHGVQYELCVFLINTKVDGVFKNVSRIPEHGKVELAGGEEFVLGYFPSHMLTPEIREDV